MHEDFTEYMAENFELSLFILSMDRDQIVWMEHNRAVGSPRSVLEAFFGGLDVNGPLSDWQAFVRHFENPESYWEAVERHRSRIAKVTFRFVPPNAFEGDALAQKFYTAIQNEAQNETLEETFKAPPGKLKLDGPMMKASAEVAEKGAGEKELYAEKGRILYSSKNGRIVEEVPEEDMPDVQNPSFLNRVISRLFDR
ncbi:hypothetical protein GCM10017621_03640 [Maricaulis virginensis]|uniref:Uncharacterized protein n=2 Tax=Maricaulis virginensis TaxID=144022 RepID=A0A9W6IKW5_9PROT|nr:hypothetical protein GCM10017621_03640 [Maricaulis virginensis]